MLNKGVDRCSMSWEDDANRALENVIKQIGYMIKNLFFGAFFGAKRLNQKKFLIGFLLSFLIPIFLVVNKNKIFEVKEVVRYVIYYLGLLSPLFYLKIISGTGGNKKVSENLKRAKIIGKDGQVPVLLSKQTDKKGYEIYTFKGFVNLSEWKKKAEDIETVMNLTIKEIKQGKRKDIVIIKTVPGTISMPGDDGNVLLWSDDYIKEKDGVVSLGRNELEEITADFNKDPHFIAAGATGSGKSVIIRSILWQFIAKGHKVIFVDFKGGLEFGEEYRRYGETITDKKSLAKELKTLIKENELRQAELGRLGAKNIIDYNKKSNKRMYRVLLVIDELGEVLDKTGLSEEELEVTKYIEGALSTFARVSRATGIHMLLGIQRPDAKIISGQIKTNVTGRICGRVADGPASEIVLSNTAAAQLPKIGGRMIYQNGGDMEVFQGYFFQDDRDVKKLKVPGDRLLVGGDVGRYDGEELISGKTSHIERKSKKEKRFRVNRISLKAIIEKLKNLIFFKKRLKEKKMIENGADPDLLDLDTIADSLDNNKEKYVDESMYLDNKYNHDIQESEDCMREFDQDYD
ncbi:MAG: type IV secretion system DNA-binding domain-containing protein [Clostridium sp.]|nr:type IV secretion system DNA-binding domain-containing protein [Clostridium sp.]